MNFISRLMPREGRFFNLFDNHAKLIVDGALALADVLQHYENQKDRESRHQAHRRRRARRRPHHARNRAAAAHHLRHAFRSRRHPSPDLAHGRRAGSHPGLPANRWCCTTSRRSRPKPSSWPNCCAAAPSTCSPRWASWPPWPMRPPSSRSARKSIASNPKPTRSCAARSRSCSARRQTCASSSSSRPCTKSLESATDKCQDVANVIESVVLENA